MSRPTSRERRSLLLEGWADGVGVGTAELVGLMGMAAVRAARRKGTVAKESCILDG